MFVPGGAKPVAAGPDDNVDRDRMARTNMGVMSLYCPPSRLQGFHLLFLIYSPRCSSRVLYFSRPSLPITASETRRPQWGSQYGVHTPVAMVRLTLVTPYAHTLFCDAPKFPEMSSTYPVLDLCPVHPRIQTSCSSCNFQLEFPVPSPVPEPSSLLTVRCRGCRKTFSRAFYPKFRTNFPPQAWPARRSHHPSHKDRHRYLHHEKGGRLARKSIRWR